MCRRSLRVPSRTSDPRHKRWRHSGAPFHPAGHIRPRRRRHQIPILVGYVIQFRGAHIEDWRCRNGRFDLAVVFERTTLDGRIVFDHVDFAGGVSFNEATLRGEMLMDEVNLGPSLHSFANLQIERSAELIMNPDFLHPSGAIDFAPVVRGECRIAFEVLDRPQGFIALRSPVVASGAQLTLDGAGENVGEVHIRDGSSVRFESGAFASSGCLELTTIVPNTPGFEIVAEKQYMQHSESANGGRSSVDYWGTTNERAMRDYPGDPWKTD